MSLNSLIALCLYISSIWPCMEYCCHVWAGVASCFLKLSDKLQKRMCRNVSPSLAGSLEPLAHCHNEVNLCLFYRYYFVRCSTRLAQVVPFPYSWGKYILYSDRLHDFFGTIPGCYKDVYVNIFSLEKLDSGILCLENAFLLPII